MSYPLMINVLIEAGMISDEKKYEKFKNHFRPKDDSDWGDLSGKAVKLLEFEINGNLNP